jgi:hypothetical protein
MILKNKNKKSLVILGAGATRGALSGTFSPRISPPLNKDFFPILSKFIKTDEGKNHALSFKRLIHFLEKEYGQKGEEYPTMEEVFNVLFISKDLPEIFSKGRGRKRGKGFRPEVMDFLGLLIRVFRFVQSRCKHRDNLNHHEMIALSLQPGDTLMTLNYDTLMDNALVEAGWSPQKGYGFQSKVIYNGNKPKKYSPNLRNVKLLKPHGSFNWFAKGSFTRLEQTLGTRPVSEVRITKLPKLYDSRAKRLVRFFIPPLYTKFFSNKFWANLWFLTYKAMRDTDRLIVIGCSLIATDYHLKAILLKALNDRKKKFKELIIVDPCADVQSKLKKFFRGRSQTGCKLYSSFSEFCLKAF